jgi:formylglycine-generating enzyme required for sulfatase activity
MGSPVTESGRMPNENQVSVTISRAFSISDTEVTQLQWFTVMGNNPSSFKLMFHCPGSHVTINGVQMCPNLPVEQISWNDIQAFLGILNSGLSCTGLPSDPAGCSRLPTEAEWEYAARFGTTTAWSWGASASSAPSYAWYSGNFTGITHPVASKSSNPGGLNDVHGNVSEWVADCYTTNLPGGTDPLFVVPPQVGFPPCHRAVRGGHFNDGVNYIRSAIRTGAGPTTAVSSYGFRFVVNQ